MPIGKSILSLSDKYRWLSDFRFWLFLAVFIRLYGIWNPPLEIQHNWRQTTVNMAARNFLEVDNNILYPRVDFAGGDKTGITGMEFPIFNYTIYLVSEVFGFQHWYGRLINLIVSTIGIWFFFKLLVKYFNEEIAWAASFLLLFSEWFIFSRKIMPDTFSVSLLFIGLYYGLEYLLQKKSWKQLIPYALLTGLGVLSKLPTGYLLAILAVPFFDKNIAVKRKLVFYTLTVIALIPSIWWYFIWVPHLVETYGFWHFYMGTGFIDGWKDIFTHFDEAIRKFYKNAMGFSGFAIYLVGLYYLLKKRHLVLLLVFITASLAFLVIMGKSGFAFYHHNYYIVPFVPIMCLVAAWGLIQLTQLWQIALLLIFFIEGIAFQLRDLSIRDKYFWPSTIESEIADLVPKDAYILMNTAPYPTIFYFTHRKGWITTNDKLTSSSYLNDLYKKGCRYIFVVNSDRTETPKLNFKMLLENSNYTLYQLSQ